MIMLFSQTDRLEWHACTISLMNVGQLWGHSCFKTEMSTRFSLLSSVRSDRNDSSVMEDCRMKATMKFRMPSLTSEHRWLQTWQEMLTLALLPRQHLPSCHDNIVEHLQGQV